MPSELSSSVWANKCLVTIEPIGPIPKGAILYCFVDYGDWFRVYTKEVYLGVNEFKLAPTHRCKVRLLR